MSRQDLAEQVKAYLFRETGREFGVDANYVGKLERGEHRWPNATYRRAFRAILAAATDAELGFFVIRGRGERAQRACQPARPGPGGRHTGAGHTGAGRIPRAEDPRCPDGAGSTSLRAGADALAEAIARDAPHASDFARAVTATFVDAVVVDGAVAHLRRIARSYGTTPLPELFAEIRELRQRVFGLIERSRHPRQLRHLHLLGSRLSGLSAHIALDRGDHAVAEIHARTAWLCASLAAHGGMQAWVRALQSVTAFRDGRLGEAVAAIREAAELRAAPGLADSIGGLFAAPEASPPPGGPAGGAARGRVRDVHRTASGERG